MARAVALPIPAPAPVISAIFPPVAIVPPYFPSPAMLFRAGLGAACSAAMQGLYDPGSEEDHRPPGGSSTLGRRLECRLQPAKAGTPTRLPKPDELLIIAHRSPPGDGGQVREHVHVDALADRVDRAVAEDEIYHARVEAAPAPIALAVVARGDPALLIIVEQDRAVERRRRLGVRGERVRPERAAGGVRAGGILAYHQRFRRAVRDGREALWSQPARGADRVQHPPPGAGQVAHMV